MKHSNLFVNQSLKSLSGVGSLWPSSSFLTRRMVQGVTGPVVLELGPGTGVFTKEILKQIPDDGKLIVIENNLEFVKYLKEQITDKRFKLYIGDASDLKQFLHQEGVSSVDFVISGLPLSNINQELRQKIIQEIHSCLKMGGMFVQFQYLMTARREIKKMFSSISITLEPLNFPPAFVMKWKKVF